MQLNHNCASIRYGNLPHKCQEICLGCAAECWDQFPAVQRSAEPSGSEPRWIRERKCPTAVGKWRSGLVTGQTIPCGGGRLLTYPAKRCVYNKYWVKAWVSKYSCKQEVVVLQTIGKCWCANINTHKKTFSVKRACNLCTAAHRSVAKSWWKRAQLTQQFIWQSIGLASGLECYVAFTSYGFGAS